MKDDMSDGSEHQITYRRLMSFYELTQRMHSEYDLQGLLEFVMDRALSLTGAQRGLLLLNDDHERSMHHVAVARGAVLPVSAWQNMEYVSSSVIKDVLDHAELRLVRDLHIEQHHQRHSPLPGVEVRSVLAVPLKTENQLMGLVYLDHAFPDRFNQDDADFLSAFASQAVLAVNRALQHQRQIEELTRLNELSRSVVQVLDLDEVLTRIVTEATRMLHVETGSVLLLNEDGTELTFATSISNGHRVVIPTRLKVNQGVAGRVARTGIPACVSAVSHDPDWFGEVETGFVTHSLLCVPLHRQGRILGVLQVLNKRGSQGFGPSDSALLSAFATSATIAIENARLFREARQADQMRSLNRVALALSSSLDLDTILSTGLEQALRMTQSEAGCLTVITRMADDDAGGNVRSVHAGLSPNPVLAAQQVEVCDHCLSVVLEDMVDEALMISRDNVQSLIRLPDGIAALTLTPLQVGGPAGGVLVIMRSSFPVYSPEDVNLLNSIARIIDLAVQNATHYNQAHAQTRHLMYLNEIGSALTRSLDLTHVLQVIIEGVNALLQTERTSVFLIDKETNELVLRYSNEGPTDIRLPAPWQGIAGWVANHDIPALVNDPYSDPRHLREIAHTIGYEAHSILCVPLKVEGRVIGVVEALNRAGKRPFTLYHEALLTELTQWAAIALHNAHLFDERVRAYEHLSAEQQRRITAEARGAMAAVVLDMAHTMNNIIGAIRVWALTLEQLPHVTLQSDSALQIIGHIRRNAEEALDLIRTMRGPLEQATIAPTDTHLCLEHALQSCWCPEHIQIDVDRDLSLPLVNANAARLEAVFQNIISNAIQALGSKAGTISIATRRTDYGQAEITIHDDGPGIAPEVQAQLFTPGVSSQEGRLGIGLWLVETFIRQFGGQIAWHSSVETGTTFIITLPAFGKKRQREDT